MLCIMMKFLFTLCYKCMLLLHVLFFFLLFPPVLYAIFSLLFLQFLYITLHFLHSTPPTPRFTYYSIFSSLFHNFTFSMTFSSFSPIFPFFLYYIFFVFPSVLHLTFSTLYTFFPTALHQLVSDMKMLKSLKIIQWLWLWKSSWSRKYELHFAEK